MCIHLRVVHGNVHSSHLPRKKTCTHIYIQEGACMCMHLPVVHCMTLFAGHDGQIQLQLTTTSRHVCIPEYTPFDTLDWGCQHPASWLLTHDGTCAFLQPQSGSPSESGPGRFRIFSSCYCHPHSCAFFHLSPLSYHSRIYCVRTGMWTQAIDDFTLSRPQYSGPVHGSTPLLTILCVRSSVCFAVVVGCNDATPWRRRSSSTALFIPLSLFCHNMPRRWDHRSDWRIRWQCVFVAVWQSPRHGCVPLPLPKVQREHRCCPFFSSWIQARGLDQGRKINAVEAGGYGGVHPPLPGLTAKDPPQE